MKRRVALVAASALGGFAIVGGFALGAVASGVPPLIAPAGLQSADDQPIAPAPEPDYAVNGNGETYGSAAEAPAPDSEPDLIQVIATNGKTGYVKKSELDEATGATAALSFKSPEEALRWQETEGRLDRSITVYDASGEKVVGNFLIAGTETQRKAAQSVSSVQ